MLTFVQTNCDGQTSIELSTESSTAQISPEDVSFDNIEIDDELKEKFTELSCVLFHPENYPQAEFIEKQNYLIQNIDEISEPVLLKIIISCLSNLQSDELKLALNVIKQKKFNHISFLLGQERLALFNLERIFCFQVLEEMFTEQIIQQFINQETNEPNFEINRVVLQDLAQIVCKLIVPYLRKTEIDPFSVLIQRFMHCECPENTSAQVCAYITMTFLQELLPDTLPDFPRERRNYVQKLPKALLKILPKIYQNLEGIDDPQVETLMHKICLVCPECPVPITTSPNLQVLKETILKEAYITSEDSNKNIEQFKHILECLYQAIIEATSEIQQGQREDKAVQMSHTISQILCSLNCAQIVSLPSRLELLQNWVTSVTGLATELLKHDFSFTFSVLEHISDLITELSLLEDQEIQEVITLLEIFMREYVEKCLGKEANIGEYLCLGTQGYKYLSEILASDQFKILKQGVDDTSQMESLISTVLVTCPLKKVEANILRSKRGEFKTRARPRITSAELEYTANAFLAINEVSLGLLEKGTYLKKYFEFRKFLIKLFTKGSVPRECSELLEMISALHKKENVFDLLLNVSTHCIKQFNDFDIISNEISIQYDLLRNYSTNVTSLRISKEVFDEIIKIQAQKECSVIQNNQNYSPEWSQTKSELFGCLTRSVIIHKQVYYNEALDTLLNHFSDKVCLDVEIDSLNTLLDFFSFIAQIRGFLKGAFIDTEFKNIYLLIEHSCLHSILNKAKIVLMEPTGSNQTELSTQNGIFEDDYKLCLITELLSLLDGIVNYHPYQTYKFEGSIIVRTFDNETKVNLNEEIARIMAIALEVITSSFSCISKEELKTEVLHSLGKCLKLFCTMCEKCKIHRRNSKMEIPNFHRFIMNCLYLLSNLDFNEISILEDKAAYVYRFMDKLFDVFLCHQDYSEIIQVLNEPQFHQFLINYLKFAIENCSSDASMGENFQSPGIPAVSNMLISKGVLSRINYFIHKASESPNPETLDVDTSRLSSVLKLGPIFEVFVGNNREGLIKIFDFCLTQILIKRETKNCGTITEILLAILGLKYRNEQGEPQTILAQEELAQLCDISEKYEPNSRKVIEELYTEAMKYDFSNREKNINFIIQEFLRA
ncbi:unnamed protein product [Moneuplotes crassus]|uniref:Uncharacterized protein n=1 Tax=Euplotes crassus TaxID=5936 RepID=A0AAD1X8K7_EUPCR|nr:unnamed protein product [Moneuplotes crassus]